MLNDAKLLDFQAEQRRIDKVDARKSKRSDRIWQLTLLLVGAVLGYFLRGNSEPLQIHNHIVIPEKEAANCR